MDTWFTYVKPKYKRALDKWNKETGGGDGTPASFVDFCGKDKWLVWIFLHDCDANFLLANNASGRIPNHLQLEAGFDTATMSDITEDDSSWKIKDFEKQLKEIKDDNSSFNNLTSLLNDYMRAKMTGSNKKRGKEKELTEEEEDKDEKDENSPTKMSYDCCLMRANYHRKQILNLAEDDTIDDEIKGQCTETLKARRKQFLMAAIEKESNKRSKTS